MGNNGVLNNSNRQSIFRSLSHRNYRLFFSGQAISLIGTWMQMIAMSWLVYRLTDSVFLLGLVGFTNLIPIFLLAPFAGVAADHWRRQRILVVTQSLAMIQAFLLAFLTLKGVIAIWQVIVLGFSLGIINAFDGPARQAFVVEMVDNREDLTNAIALNSLLFNGARLLGPSIAGVLIALLGEGMCFLLNAVSYIAVIAALLAMSFVPRDMQERKGSVIEGLREGLRYSFTSIPIRSILTLLGVVSLVGMPYTVLMPVFARDIFYGGPHTLGSLMSASGVGAVVGAIYLASRRNAEGLGKVLLLAAGMFGLGLVSLSFSRILWVSLVLMVVTGFGMIVQMASSNTLIQSLVDDSKRGRVMSLYNVAFLGMAPFGNLLAGSLANRMGAPDTLMVGGLLCLLGVAVFYQKIAGIEAGTIKLGRD